jgi:hypothetical protein
MKSPSDKMKNKKLNYNNKMQEVQLIKLAQACHNQLHIIPSFSECPCNIHDDTKEGLWKFYAIPSG